MTRFDMIGLRADNPQAWMAAVGVLFILDHQGQKVQLSWQQLTPVLHGMTGQEVVACLCAYLESGSQALDLLADIPKDPVKNKIALDFTAGRVNFVDVINNMISDVKETHIRSALTQGWKNEDDEVSLGWDPQSVKHAASLSGDKAPDAARHRTQLGGQWLAAESLAVTCPLPNKLKRGYNWVTWQVPLDMEGVFSVVQAQTTAWSGVRYVSNIGFSGNFKVFQPASQQ